MHRLATSFVLGYHGCDEADAERVLAGAPFKKSENAYDWLGHGVYFWEANPERGLAFAKERTKGRGKKRIKKPTVIGAVIDLGFCLDLCTTAAVEQIKIAYSALELTAEAAKGPMPTNSDDQLARNLDCAVIEMLHDVRSLVDDTPIETVRGIFIEGGPIYPGGGIYEKTHTQICVRNLENIKGIFRVPTHVI